MSEIIRKKFAECRKALSEALIERDTEIDLALTALAAHESYLTVGAPGCAKSHLFINLFKWVDAPAFSTILSKFTLPEEIFGPLALTKLRDDRYVRNTDRRLPQADIAFFDEIWKSSPAIRGVKLRILNEKIFENDGIETKVPLKSFFAASNEWPNANPGAGEGQEDAALFDRFLIRSTTRAVRSKAGLKRLRWAGDHTPVFKSKLTAAELASVKEIATKLPWSESAKEALDAIDSALAKELIFPSNRRQYKSVGIVSAYAWINGANTVEAEHLEVLSHILWDDPAQAVKVAEVVCKVANPIGPQIRQFLKEVEEIVNETDARNIAQAHVAASKLKEIDRKLVNLNGGERAEKARAHVRQASKSLKLAATESF